MIKKKGITLTSVEEWGKYAGPKESNHWKEYRSAMESAKAWFDTGAAEIPLEINKVIESHKDFEQITSWEAEPEALLHFDDFSGPSNMDVLVTAEDKLGKFIVGIEAKADEPFSDFVKDRFSDGLETKITSPNSKKIIRIQQLADSLFSKRGNGETKVGDLRYQLLTGLAGTIAKAINEQCQRATFLIHEFITPLTTAEKHARNRNDLNEFLTRITNNKITELQDGELYGPIVIPGYPLFNDIPSIYFGKAIRHINE